MIYEYEIRPSMTISTLTSKIVLDMSNCPMQYEFSTRFPHGIARHEAHPIRVLALTNRGRPRPTTGHTYLQRMAISGTTPISELFSNRNFYANPRFCLENDRFVLYFGMLVVLFYGKFLALKQNKNNSGCALPILSYASYRKHCKDCSSQVHFLPHIPPIST